MTIIIAKSATKQMKISESFYSIQGEGVTQGIPAYFVRLQGCNLMCGGVNGKLLKEGKASWYCDSEAVWRQGTDVDNNGLVDRLVKAEQLDRVLTGETHMVWTGGEPLMARNAQDIQGFIDYLGDNNSQTYHEIETNGSVYNPQAVNLLRYMNQVNCSPKLSNSGMPVNARINYQALDMIKAHPNPWFKFVISNEEDLREAMLTYIEPYDLPKNRIILMPGSDSMATLPYMTRMCFELSKTFGYRTISRSHILAYDKKTGV